MKYTSEVTQGSSRYKIRWFFGIQRVVSLKIQVQEQILGAVLHFFFCSYFQN